MTSVIFPNFLKKNITSILISTVANSFNHYSRMLTAVDDYGDPLFASVRFFPYCDECKEKGIEDTCRHKEGELAWWLSEGQKDKVRKFLGETSDTYGREILGEICDSNIKQAFNENNLYDLYNQSRFKTEKNDPEVFVTVDPCGQGRSEYAITSVFYYNEYYVVSISFLSSSFILKPKLELGTGSPINERIPESQRTLSLLFFFSSQSYPQGSSKPSFILHR